MRQEKQRAPKRKFAKAKEFDVVAALQRIQEEKKVDCWVTRCPRGLAKPAHNPCCSIHDKPLCCEHYVQLHFVEVGAVPCHTE